MNSRFWSRKGRIQVRNLVLLLCALLTASASENPKGSNWRPATEKELSFLIPERVPVVKERIETELPTASGVSDGQGKFIAGVVIITAGYSAEGLYSHFLLTQVPIQIGGVVFKPGDYVFGSKRIDATTLEVKFYEANTGKFLVAVNATIDPKKGAIHSLEIAPPTNGKGVMKLGRFAFDYTLAG